MKAYSETGAIGFPTRASTDKGKLLFEHLVNEIEKTVTEFIEL
jgi:creatinine amidohydrolase